MVGDKRKQISMAYGALTVILMCFIFAGCHHALGAAEIILWDGVVEITQAAQQNTTATTPEAPTTEQEPTSTVSKTEGDQSSTASTASTKTPTSSSLQGQRIQVPYISQRGSLPNGCEAVSATMLLQYWGYMLTAEEFVDQYLPCESICFSTSPWKGPDPNQAYAGDPRSPTGGFGCFAPVIMESLNKVVKGTHQVKNLTGITLEALCRDYIDQGIPAAIWATIDMRAVKKYYLWESEDGSETYEYPGGEHCLVLVGYDDKNYYFNDPLKDGLTAYKKSVVEQRFEALERQAVVIVPVA